MSSKLPKIQTPFLGCAYYPEDWDDSQLEYDISMMLKAGIYCARIGEFAWRKMEPEEGRFDFAWLHRVVDALRKAGISVVMGTPTATPPIWLSRKHPEVLKHLAEGHQNHGGRRHCCSCNPDYIAACDKIVEALGREFGEDPNIIGWQLDNEIISNGTACTCPHCMRNFHERLRRVYGTVDELNARWNLNLFSQAYDDFDEVPPDLNAWHNPHLKFEWAAAHHDADIAFIHRQYDILKKFTSAPIGTDMMPYNSMDYEEMTSSLDVVQFNHYHEPDSLHKAVFWFDFLRTLKDRPFWNTETATTWNGHILIGQFMKPEGYCRVNSWLPVALGGECAMYWLWRQHWAGHELMHGSVLSPEGRPTHTFTEVQQTAADFENAADFISGTKVQTDVALHFSSLNWNLFEQQPFFWSNTYTEPLYKLHRQLTRAGLRPDVIGPRHALDGYKVLFSPLMMTLEENDLPDRLRAWVENGGVWIAGPMTDVRNNIGAHYLEQATGMIEKWLGTRLEYSIPSDGTVLEMQWRKGPKLEHGEKTNGHERNWVEVWKRNKGEALATVIAGHTAVNGRNVIVRHKVGKGEVILCGTLLTEKDLTKLIETVICDSDVEPFDTTGELVVARRAGKAGKGLVICETAHEDASIRLPGPMKDLIDGTRHDGVLRVRPYGVHVLVEC